MLKLYHVFVPCSICRRLHDLHMMLLAHTDHSSDDASQAVSTLCDLLKGMLR